jgi:hypothetical protein
MERVKQVRTPDDLQNVFKEIFELKQLLTTNFTQLRSQYHTS